jgi:excisionase family DNA binding protein
MGVVELISTAEAARRKGVDQSSVRRAIREGRLRGSLFGRDYMVDASDVEAWQPRRKKERRRGRAQMAVHDV